MSSFRLSLAATFALSACATPAQMHTQEQLNTIATGCGLALGELIQDEMEKRVVIALRSNASQEQRVCVTAARLCDEVGAEERPETRVRRHSLPGRLMPKRTDILRYSPSPRRGEDGARSASGEGARLFRIGRTPSPNPLPVGERDLETATGEEQFTADDFQDAFGVGEHIVVPKADHSIAERLDDLGAWSVGFGRVLAAVEFDGEVQIAAGEIRDEAADRELAEELSVFEAAGAEVIPEPVFGVRASAAEVTCDGRQALFCQGRTPSPQPSPRRGEGAIRRLTNTAHGSSAVNA
jgi:hypothetical protein